MNITIAPMSLGDIFDRLLKLIGKTWLRNLIICSIILLPLTILFAAGLDIFFSNILDLVEHHADDGDFQPSDFLDILGVLLWMILAGFLFALGTYGATLAVTIVGCAEMLGEPMTWNDALSRGFGIRFLRMIGLLLLQSLIIGGLVLIPYGLLIAGIASESIVLGFFGFFLVLGAVGFVVFLAVRWAFAIPALGWEDSGVIESLRRSWHLVGGNWWRVFGILILMAIIVSFASSIVLTPLYVVFLWDFFMGYIDMLQSLGMGGRPDPETIGNLLKNIGVGIGLLSGISSILQLLVTPLYTVVLYFDLRARKGEFPSAAPATTA